MGQEYIRRPITTPSLTASSGGIDIPVAAPASTATVLVNYGVHTLTGTSDTPNYVLQAPQAGVGVFLQSILATSSQKVSVTLAAGASLYSSNSTATDLRKITFGDGNAVAQLIGVSTSKYTVIALRSSAVVGTT